MLNKISEWFDNLMRREAKPYGQVNQMGKHYYRIVSKFGYHGDNHRYSIEKRYHFSVNNWEQACWFDYPQRHIHPVYRHKDGTGALVVDTLEEAEEVCKLMYKADYELWQRIEETDRKEKEWKKNNPPIEIKPPVDIRVEEI